MKWENLKQNACPHCAHPLEFDGELEITCTHCIFHISPVRFKSIRDRRAQADGQHIQLRWQNLTKDCCPQCGESLMNGTARNGYEMTVCIMGPTCPFKIRNDKLKTILGDPTHPAHQFKV